MGTTMHGALSIFLFALLVLIFPFHVVVFSQEIDKNGEILLEFKSALGNSEGLATWNASSTPCSGNKTNWIGVSCLGGNVTGLKVEMMGLGGKIDVDSLVSLSTLRTLSLQNNNFSGKMPDWQKLATLRSLNISHNKFSGEIPGDRFHGMSYLKRVDLGYNEFKGKIPVSLSSISLLELRLENNKFSGFIPDFRSGIKLLNVSNNQLKGPIPQSLANFDASAFSVLRPESDFAVDMIFVRSIGNEGLCGKPMGSECKQPKAKITTLAIVTIGLSILALIAMVAMILPRFLTTKDRSYVNQN